MENWAVIEKSVIAEMMANPADVFCSVDADDFAIDLYRDIFVAGRKLFEQKKPVDIVTLVVESGQKINAVTECANFPRAIDVVAPLKEAKRRRDVKALGQMIMDSAYSADLESLASEVIEKFSPKASNSGLITPKDFAEKALCVYNDRKDREGNGGISTQFRELNIALNGGFEPEQLIIIAAPTKKGKSAFAANLLKHIGIIKRVPSLLLNTEMSLDQMALRNLSMLSQVDHYTCATGASTPAQDSLVFDAVEMLRNSALFQLQVPDMNTGSMISLIRKHTLQNKIKIACVDYIGRIDTMDSKLQEHQVLKLAAKRLKTAAQQLKITIVMLAQMTDAGTLEGAKAMRNECDLFAHLRPMTETEMSKVRGFNYVLDIENNRSGGTPKIAMNYYGETLTFSDEAKTSVFDGMGAKK